jgi:hypothetical protein
MIPDIIERYLIEIILFGGFFLAGPLARIIADSAVDATAEEKNQSFTEIRLILRVLFAGLIALSLLLFKILLPPV